MNKRFSDPDGTTGPRRPGKVMAMLQACAIAVPVLVLLNLIEWLWF
jgi:hypothetical protein